MSAFRVRRSCNVHIARGAVMGVFCRNTSHLSFQILYVESQHGGERLKNAGHPLSRKPKIILQPGRLRAEVGLNAEREHLQT